MKEILKKEDFSQVNFGILIADRGDDTFIFQEPRDYDKSRAAQDSCVLFINDDKQAVNNFYEALIKCNKFINELHKSNPQIADN